MRRKSWNNHPAPRRGLLAAILVGHFGVIGSDFNHGSGIIGFGDESEAPNVTRELVRRGY